MEPLVSVIVPVYNGEKYIRECLDSLINQTHKNLEIVVVNDGSTDGTKGILKSYKKMDSRIKVINKANGGVSTARNAALNIISGEFVHFLDADDWMSPDAYKNMLWIMKSENVDVGIMNAYNHTENGEASIRITDLPEGKYNKIALIKYACGVTGKSNKVITNFMCTTNKVYRSSLFYTKEGEPIRFKVGMKYLEDGHFLMNVMNNVRTGYFYNKGFYHIRKHEESAMGKLDFASLSEQMLDGYEEVLKCITIKENPVADAYIRTAFTRAALYYLRMCCSRKLDDAALKICDRFVGDENFRRKAGANFRERCLAKSEV